MKKSRKALLTALYATLAVTFTTGLAMTAFADEATKDHEFSSKQDLVFEDFDRADISDTVKVTSVDGVNTGVSPYLHVEFEAVTAETPAADRVSQIYKNGSGSIANISSVSGGTITVRMRAPEGNLKLSQLYFGVRGAGNNDDSLVVAKTFMAVTGAEEDEAISNTWANYEIVFASAFEDSDVYDGTNTAVTSTDLEGIHIYAENDVGGVLDIDYISYGPDVFLNEFRGEGDLMAMAKTSDAGAYWTGSTYGEVIKRAVTMTGESSFTVVKDTAVGKFAYAVIEAEGDIANLKIATTTDGTTFGEAKAYDGYSVNLTGDETGFEFIYSGEGSVKINRIYLTNNITQAPATAMPVINAASASILEDFSVSQSGFTGVWEDMSTAPELETAGLDYRLSYNNGDMVEVKDGCLVFDATDLGDGYINYKFKSKSAAQGKYVILKVKGEGGANVDMLRFALGSPDEYHYLAWKELANQIGIHNFTRDDNKLQRGVSRMESLEVLLRKCKTTYTEDQKIELAEIKNNIYKTMLEKMSPDDLDDKVLSTLNALRVFGLKLAIGSSSKNTPFILNRLGLDGFFDAVADGNSVTRSKPNPDVFLKAAEMLGEKPRDCLVVEDAVAGIQAGIAGGFAVAGIGVAKNYPDTMYPLNNLTELLKILIG